MSHFINTPSDLDTLDEIDRKIIKYLQENGREAFAKIGDDIGVPSSTVRDRTNRLIENDILRIIGLLNPLKARKRVMANVGVRLSSGRYRAIADEIAKFEQVSYLVICAGSFDLMVEVVCYDNTDLLDFTAAVKDIPDVKTVETFIYYTIVKEVLTWGSSDNWGRIGE